MSVYDDPGARAGRLIRELIVVRQDRRSVWHRPRYTAHAAVVLTACGRRVVGGWTAALSRTDPWHRCLRCWPAARGGGS